MGSFQKSMTSVTEEHVCNLTTITSVSLLARKTHYLNILINLYPSNMWTTRMLGLTYNHHRCEPAVLNNRGRECMSKAGNKRNRRLWHRGLPDNNYCKCFE